MQKLVDSIQKKKEQLDQIRPLSKLAIENLQKYYDVELTYTSNAIEGNTLTFRETSEVIEHGITVGGKSLREHLEVVDHFEALLWMRDLANKNIPINEKTVCEMHQKIVARSHPSFAGIYSTHVLRIAGSRVVFPNPVKIPQLMQNFGRTLETLICNPMSAFDAHFQLTAIHPFSDGNGRTSRLLMNLILIRGGYPPLSVRPEDRKAYLDSLETASLTNDLSSYYYLMHQRLDLTLNEYLSALNINMNENS
jgi:Fic family protein